MSADAPRPALRGRTVVTTREQRGELDRRLAALGADVVHVPLVEEADPADGGAALDAALGELDRFDWVVVTSPRGARRVAPALASSTCRIGVVGTSTGATVAALAGRPPDVVPDRQTALDLAGTIGLVPSGTTLLLAQADRADPAHAAAFAGLGFDVTTVVAYRTLTRTPTWRERRAALAADALSLASGSAAVAWRAAIGAATPPVVAAIGPATAAAAREQGIKVTHVAADHSIGGLVDVIVGALGDSS
jgi:uroporphyrinogen-III synthase